MSFAGGEKAADSNRDFVTSAISCFSLTFVKDRTLIGSLDGARPHTVQFMLKALFTLEHTLHFQSMSGPSRPSTIGLD